MDGLNMANLKAYLVLARPRHYIKNIFVLVPLFFSHEMTDLPTLAAALGAFVCFCLAASAVYVLNDLADMHKDREQPGKQKRPLAAGEISPRAAGVYAAILLGLFLPAGFFLVNPVTFFIIIGYVGLNVAYALVFQHIVAADLLAVSFGFVLRVFAGGAAIDVYVSRWLIWLTFLLAFFLVTAKRRNDMARIGETRREKGAGTYTLAVLSYTLMASAVVAVISYAVYVFSPEVMAKHGSKNLFWTLLPVLGGFLRYLHLTFIRGASGSPVAVIYRDGLMQAIVAAWIGLFGLIFYTEYL